MSIRLTSKRNVQFPVAVFRKSKFASQRCRSRDSRMVHHFAGKDSIGVADGLRGEPLGQRFSGHVDANDKDQAGIPNVKQCVLCHLPDHATHPELKKLAQLDRRGKQVKWVRVYRVPDFVFFSHVNHLKAGEKCATCHGPVEASEVLAREVSTSMNTCMNCHSSRKASNECYLCHDLGQ